MKRTLIIAALSLAGLGTAHAQFIETNFESGIITLPVKDAATHQMIRDALKEKDPLTRVQALSALSIMRDPADLPLMRALINDPVPTVREQALHSTGGTVPAAPENTPILTMANALGRSPSVAEIRAGLSHPNLAVQEAAVDAVGRLRVAELAPAVVPLLKSTDSVLRRHICEALGKAGNDQAAALAGQLARDDDPFVQRAAGEALLALHSDADREALIGLLKNPRVIVRCEAALALGQWKQPTVALVLHDVLKDPEPKVVRSAAEALGRLGNPESKPPLLEALTREVNIAQERIAWALGELHATEAVTTLIPLLNSSAHTVQTSVAEALGKIGDKQAIPFLQKVLVEMTAHGTTARQRSIEALRHLNDRDSVKRVMQIITEKVIPPPPASTEWSYDMDDTRAEGVRYLEFIGDPKLATTMLEKIKDAPSYRLRKIMAAGVTKLLGKPYMACFSTESRHYWIESIDSGTGMTPFPMPGIVPVE